MSTATTTCLSLFLIAFNIVAIAFLLKIQKQLRNTRDNMVALRKQLTESPRVRSHNDGPTNAKPLITPKPQFPKQRKIKEDFCA